MGSSLAISDRGSIWLSWLEPVGDKEHAFKCASFDPARQEWTAARVIASGANFFVNWADFPVLAAGANRLTAVWFVNSPGGGDHDGYHAEFSVSTNEGETWSKPQPITGESASVEFVALQPLKSGEVLAAWLDGRNRHGGGASDRQALYARVIGTKNSDVVVDPSVCDCCQVSLIPTADGGALVAYRGRSLDEIRDMRFARFRAGRWESPQTLHADGWKIAGCPVNGPQLAANGRETAAVWFTGANNQSSVHLARANDALTGFAAPTRVDLGRPQGRVDSVMLPNGTAIVTWLESSGTDKEGGIYLRAQSARGELSAPALLGSTTTARASGFPRVVLLSDTTPSRLLLSYTQEGEPSRVATCVVTIK